MLDVLYQTKYTALYNFTYVFINIKAGIRDRTLHLFAMVLYLIGEKNKINMQWLHISVPRTGYWCMHGKQNDHELSLII